MKQPQALKPLRYVELDLCVSVRVELADDNSVVRISQEHVGGPADIRSGMDDCDLKWITAEARGLIYQATRPMLPGSKAWRYMQKGRISLGEQA